jgi:hypothetical protein
MSRNRTDLSPEAATRYSWGGLAIGLVALWLSAELDNPRDPSAAVLVLFFLVLPIGFLVAVAAGVYGLVRGSRLAAVPPIVVAAVVGYGVIRMMPYLQR